MPLGTDWLEQLLHQRRVFRVGVASQTRYAAIEDAGRLRDALGITPPADVPAALLEPVAHPLLDVVSRFARTRGPFRLDELTARFGIGSDPAQVALRTLVAAGRVVEGEFFPQGRGVEWCDLNVLTTLKRRSLARLRKSIAPVEPRQFARFLPYWQHVVEPRCGLDGLLDVIQQLQGFVIPLSSLERDILPRRVVDYQPSDLDQLCAAGEVVWRGYEPLGAADGRVSLFLTDQLPLLAAPPGEVADGLPNQIRELLSRRGALFFDEIAKSIGGFRNDLVAALWELVWAGVVTNDTLAPLRQFDPSAASRSARAVPAARPSAGVSPSISNASPTSWSLTSRSAASAASGNVASGNAATGRAASASPAGFRSRRAPRLPAAQGRWTLLERTGETQPTATERLTALALQLLARYGIVTRDMVIEEGPPGGFAALYPIYQALEERGQIRRGYFVEELGAVQFAASGADEQLRLAGLADARTFTLAATDPANPFGAVLPWPRFGETESRMQRAAGARVILRDGKLLGWVARGGQQITTVTRIAPAAESSADTESDKKSRGVSKVVDGSGNEGFTGFDADELQALATAVDGLAPPEEPIFLTKIDGRAPESTDLGAELLKRGFVTTSQGLLRRRRLPDENGHATRAAATSRRELLLPGYVATESRAAAGESRDVEGESRGGVGE
ncbi:MAG TPA: hypothetical protein PLV92_10980, partial [Pirellulaceae bacterium]|nr:hypothetical protein [Pirellulaceae bacterium]